MSERPKYHGDHYWRNGDTDWWDKLPVEDRPNVGYIPKNFQGPSLNRDGINLREFIKGNVARITPNPTRRPNTPPGGRTQKTPRLENYDAVVEASPNGANDFLTNNRRDPTQKCHAQPWATRTTAGYAIDQCKGDAPGTWFPCARDNNFFASANMHAEESANKWLLFNIVSPHNLNFAEAILDLVAYNLDASPQDRVKFSDYFPPLERTSSENRGYPCLAVCVTSATDFRIFRKDGKTEIDPGRTKLKDNGIIFVTHLCPYATSARTAQVIRYWDWIGRWPKRDKPFNNMINELIDTLRWGTQRWFQPGVGETPAFYKAVMENKNPERYIHPVTGLVGIAKPGPPEPVRGLISPETRSVRPGLLDAFYYPSRPDRITRAEARAEKNRLAKRRAIEEAPPSPCASDVSDYDGNAAPTQTATTQAAATPDSNDENEEGHEVNAEASNPVREEEKEGDAPFSPPSARIISTQPELSDEEDVVEKSPQARRISRIPIRRKMPTPPVESENEEEFDEENKPVRQLRTRSAAQKKGTNTVTASNNEVESPAAGRRLRTRADTKAANTATNDAANVNAAPKRSKRIAAIEGKAAATTTNTQSSAVAGPGPSTTAMRRRKRNEDSNSEASKESRKQKKQKQAQQQKPRWK